MKPRLCGCTLDQLDELTNPDFDAPTLDDFLAEIPESAVEEAEEAANEGEPAGADKPDFAAD